MLCTEYSWHTVLWQNTENLQSRNRHRKTGVSRLYVGKQLQIWGCPKESDVLSRDSHREIQSPKRIATIFENIDKIQLNISLVVLGEHSILVTKERPFQPSNSRLETIFSMIASLASWSNLEGSMATFDKSVHREEGRSTTIRRRATLACHSVRQLCVVHSHAPN